MHRLDRRRFVQGCAAAAAVVGSVQRPESADADDSSKLLPIVDTHQHLWDLERFRLPWLEGAPEVLRRSYTPDDYRAAIEGQNVVKAVYMEVDVAPEQQVQEARHLIELCQSGKTPTVAAVISGRPNSAEFKAYITQFKKSPYIKGVRQVLHAPSADRGLCLEPQFVKSMRLLGELGLSFDLCMRPSELADGVKLASEVPGTRFIVDHCGNADPRAFLSDDVRGGERSHDPDKWRRDIDALAKRDNVICKISGIVARVPKSWDAEMLAPIVNHCLDAFGPDRVVFGGDWPVCKLGATYREWTTALRQIIASRPRGDQRKLLHDNAVRLYGLS
ncbi:MAG: amidohydrolase family protein [Pirellulaceae bacterium]